MVKRLNTKNEIKEEKPVTYLFACSLQQKQFLKMFHREKRKFLGLHKIEKLGHYFSWHFFEQKMRIRQGNFHIFTKIIIIIIETSYT